VLSLRPEFVYGRLVIRVKEAGPASGEDTAS